MEINKNVIRIEKLMINMEIEHTDIMADQEKFLKRVLKSYYMDMAKNELIEARKVEEEVTNKTNYILDYTNRLYNLNRKNFQLIESLYEELDEKK